ncbi:MAG: hypothetical protein EKK56_07920 [Flavobacteriaceae bacterium]|nr:MAG: hypothetical protein EKK56_07920 [Flavobacteriaceae bacterium]
MSKIINNFQGRQNSILFKSPVGGMNSNSIDNVSYAKYIQNMLLDENNNLVIRNGTKIVANHIFDENKIFRDQLKLMEYINSEGESEILVYQNYISNLLYVNIQDNVKLDTIAGSPNITKVTIDTTPLNDQQKTYLSKVIFDGTYFYVRQDTFSDGADISNVLVEVNKITFNIPFPEAFFDIDSTDIFDPKNAFQLWIERAGIYKFKVSDNLENFTELLLDLNPNVIVSYINYQNKLIICNGIDPVIYYSNNILQELKSNYQIVQNSIEKISNTEISINVSLNYENELRDNLKIGNQISIFNNFNNEIFYTITNVNFVLNINNIKINIILNNDLVGDPKNILYKKSIPAFSYINVINDRLFALDSGGSFYKKFRSPDKSMLIYYCSKRKSIFDWYNKTGFIESINLASNSNKIDDLQCFNTYQGRILFWGKESVQIWTGNDPTVINDGQNIDFGDFKWQKTEPIGIFHKNMYVELPNTFIFLSKFGICSLKIDGFNNLNIDLSFAESINGHIKKQLENIVDDREYRSLNCFLYPYGGFLGFRFVNNCYIYQLKEKRLVNNTKMENSGFWSVFTQNFSESNSFLYDSVSKNLYLSNKNEVVVYCDKLKIKNYVDLEINPIVFHLQFNWVNMPSTWYNENIYIGCISYQEIPINICVYTNFNTADCKSVEISVDQINTKFDFSFFNFDKYSYNEKGIFPQETLRFSADSVLLNINGIAYNEFIIDSIYLSGGINNAN